MIHQHSKSIVRGMILFLSIVLSVAAFPSEEIEALAQEVRNREIAFAKTMADRDLEAFSSFISPEAIFFNGNDALRGREEIVSAWAGFFEGDTAPFSWHPDTSEVLKSGELALSSGPIYDPSGKDNGRFNSVWRKEADGQWMIIFDKGS